MKIRYDRPVSRSARIAHKLAIFAAVMMLIALLAHRFGPLGTPDLVTLTLAASLPAALAVPLALAGLFRLWSVGAEGGISATKALIYSALPLSILAFGVTRVMTLPMIHEVTTDTIDPPAFIVDIPFEQKWLPRPEVTPASRRIQSVAYAALTGRRYEGALDRVYEAVVRVAAQNRWEITATRGAEYAMPEFAAEAEGEAGAGAEGAPALDGGLGEAVPEIGPVPRPRPDPVTQPSTGEPPGTVRLQGQTRTFLIGIPFDVVIRLREEVETTLVDVRVSSRYGPHDLGLSAEATQQFLRALDVELLGVAGD